MRYKYPSEWKISLLDDVTDRGSGHTPSQNNSEYWNGGIKWVSLADSSKLDNLFIANTDKEISVLGLQNSSAVKHPAGTVILSRDAGIGKSAILKEDMAVSQHFIVWRCLLKEIIYNVYLYYWLQLMKPEFERMAVGSTIKTIGLPYFKKLKIAYPPLPEQRKIAEILNTWDKAIALLEQLITAKRKLKQGLMQQLLTGKKRFEEFEVNKSLDVIPEGWKVVNIGDLTYSHSYGPRFSSNNYDVNGNVKTIRNTDIAETGEILYDQVPTAQLESEIIDQHKLRTGDLIVITTADCGLSAIFEEQNITYIPSAYAVKYTLKSTVLPTFIKYFMSVSIAQKQVEKFIRKGTVANLPGSDVLKIKLALPPLPEQQKIASILSTADAEISNLEKQLAAYKQQKRGLMQQLITGKKRVKIEADVTV